MDGMMASFPVWIVSPAGYPHSQAFTDLAGALSSSLRALGYDAPAVHSPPRQADSVLVLGANLLPFVEIPPDLSLILFNLEQVTPGSTWFTPQYISVLRRYPVVDYSHRNIEGLRSMGITAVYCGIGYDASLENISPAALQDIDVFFYGSVNERRMRILQDLKASNVNVVAMFNCYGDQRNNLIARSRIVLNMHFYEGRVFEIVRVSHLLANRKCVVSEVGVDAALEQPFQAGVAFAEYGEIVDTCRGLLQDDSWRDQLAGAGHEAIRARLQSTFLSDAILSLARDQSLLATFEWSKFTQ